MFVCAQLSAQVEGQAQQCLVWAEQLSVLPPLNLQQGTLLSFAMLSVLAAAWGISAVGKLFDKD